MTKACRCWCMLVKRCMKLSFHTLVTNEGAEKREEDLARRKILGDRQTKWFRRGEVFLTSIKDGGKEEGRNFSKIPLGTSNVFSPFLSCLGGKEVGEGRSGREGGEGRPAASDK